MRDDVKIGILLGALLLVGVFVFWRVHAANEAGPAVELTGRNEPPVRVVADTTPPPADPPADRSEAPAPVLLPRSPLVIPSTPVETPPSLDEIPPATISATPPRPPAAAPVTGLATAPPAAATVGVTAEFNRLQVSPDGVRLYSTQTGDSQWSIAMKFYGKGTAEHLKLLADANPNVRFSPLAPNINIRIPQPPASLATSAVSPAGPATAGLNEYVVQPEDTLMKIAKAKLGDANLWRKIQEVNPDIDERRLPVGKVIKLPPKDGAATTATASPTGPTPRPTAPVLGPNEYLIKQGDTFSSIAREKLGHEKHADLIIRANPGVDPARLQIGQKIKLPPKPEPAGSSTPADAPAPSLPPRDEPRLSV